MIRMEKKLQEVSLQIIKPMKSKSVIIMLLSAILLSCNNNYKKYGEKVSLDDTEINGATSLTSFDSKLFRLRFLNNPYKINNRSVILKIDTTIIYRGVFTNSTDLEVKIPDKYVGKFCNPNLIIYKNSDTDGYYFESKNGLFIDTLSNIMSIKFSKDKDFSDRIQFEVK